MRESRREARRRRQREPFGQQKPPQRKATGAEAQLLRVSPSYTTEHLTDAIDTKIDVFEDQVRGWVLDHAGALLDTKYQARDRSNIAVLMILTSYFEQIASYVSGQSSRHHEGEFFRKGLEAVFPKLRDELAADGRVDAELAIAEISKVLYSELRCGLFHEAMIRGRILLTNLSDNSPMGIMVRQGDADIGSVTIDTAGMFKAIAAHFQGYVAALRDPAQKELRANFESFWASRVPTRALVLPPPEAVKVQSIKPA